MKYHVFPASAAKYKEGEIHPALYSSLCAHFNCFTTALLPGDAEFKDVLSESEIRRLVTLEVYMLVNRADVCRDTGRAGGSSLSCTCTCCVQVSWCSPQHHWSFTTVSECGSAQHKHLFISSPYLTWHDVNRLVLFTWLLSATTDEQTKIMWRQTGDTVSTRLISLCCREIKDYSRMITFSAHFLELLCFSSCYDRRASVYLSVKQKLLYYKCN